ncbi:PAS domain-containing protein [Actinoplanes sp. NPDC049599]|uniref:PAS domain-containing sensor histidine kinase n=1 Tax=Actinoplanes sp. NPDC049599 TaxID=3363903 RepID=UPI0037A8A44F
MTGPRAPRPAPGGPPPLDLDARAVAEAVRDAVWVVSGQGLIRYANERARQYPGGDGAPWSSLVHPDDADAVAARPGAEPYEVECRIGADGSSRWHSVRFTPARPGDDPAGSWIVTATDLDDRRCLAETRSLLETLESAAPAGFGFVDSDARLARVNDTLAALGSVPRSQQLGMPVHEALAALWPQLEIPYRRAWQTAEAVVGTAITAPAADGTDGLRSWLLGCYPVCVGARPMGVALVLVDVTEREQAQAFRSVIMDDLAEGLYTVDGDGKLTSMNRAASEMLGWQEQELLGLSVHDVVHAVPWNGAPQPESECPLRRIRPDALQTVDETFVRKDGSTFGVACSVAPLENGGGPPGAVVTFRDMTEVRRAELEDRHDQKLESLGRLSAGLAHEINTPIQFVGDNTRFLADAYQDMVELLLVYRECMTPALGEVEWGERTQRAQAAELKADIEYLATEIPAAVSQSLEGVERVASLVRAMKSFSYKDSSEQAYADLNEAIRTTLTVARNEVKYVADVVLELGELPDVLCHLGDLNQVFLNLLVNAADALKDKAERGEIRITSTTAGPTVVLSFADNGAGIPEDIQQSIFEPFFTTKEVGKGTGQGLALARAVLEKHGGSIEVRSAVGQGTEFIVRLPIAGKQDASA